MMRPHPLRGRLVVRPDAVEVPAPPQREQELEERVDLRARRVADIADPDEPCRPRRVGRVLEAYEGIVRDCDSSLPPPVQELRPGQVFRLFADDARVVPERVE